MEDEGWAGYIWDRSTIRLAIVLAGLVVFGIFTAISSYHYYQNNLKRHYLEKTASEILGTRVTIGGLYWRPAQHTLALIDINVANPPGFDIPNAIHIMGLRIKTDTMSPTAMVFSQIIMAHTTVNLTFGRDASNLMILHSNLARTTAVTGPDGKPVTVIIKNLRSWEGFSVLADVVPADRPALGTDIDAMRLSAIGEKENGIPVAQAITWIFDQIIASAFMAEARAGGLEPMSNRAIQDIKSNLNMGPDFIDLALRGPVVKNKSGAKERGQ